MLHAFTGGSSDGAIPSSGRLTENPKNGSLFGTTTFGGTYNFGVAYIVSPLVSPNGTWTEAVILNFTGGSIVGAEPNGLNFVSGVLYGTAAAGGKSSAACEYGSCGTAFKLVYSRKLGYWQPLLLHEFDHQPGDGLNPKSSVILDKSGNAYGTTSGGGAHGYGTVWKVEP